MTTEESQARGAVFTVFGQLPIEIRLQIWELSIPSRVVKWIRKNEKNIFSASSKSLPLLEVCQESRQAALLYGSYVKVSAVSGYIWFSPREDFLFFDPGWIGLFLGHHEMPRIDPLDSILPQLEHVRNIMVHPNYTDDRKKPTTMFEKLPLLERVLVAADEKSIGLQNKFMLGTVHDIRLYYVAMVKKRKPDVRVPYISVGCLGWVGDERRKMHHGDGDNRRLVAICDNYSQMMMHLSSVREEEWRFIQERGSKPSLRLNLRWRHNPTLTPRSSRVGRDIRPATPTLPSYSDVLSPQDQLRPDVELPSQDSPDTPKSRWLRAKRWCRKLLRG
ncbi:hypothetical protein EG329_002540 [Mollisiaceae sp. DMI_Dod_QoI]|nr:hypothetical protein EG329_002540 [Helotiales sp. DMI_Dod_QoI]